ncbi:uncharacterized protein NKAPD1 [Electrophorus electricus]|uniref:NKAP domain containing 1 n=2 Tax=Electrophorus TaxID=8004 RepID=A0A4W4GDJ1_ELEEL|nr:uncharacterized protein NKAPD1 [Electrophorus electricus]XP_026869442.1 uncharacterized protein NKAPD1 [Electrophorus electricus]XP_035390151.1 uncharacterized protein NKAPD1 [Electrophorus electricus]
MSRVPVGKVLLRNVIRHTDAHNKIQEESEMWKLRDMELQGSSANAPSHRWMTSRPWARGNMHCDRCFEDSEGSARDRLGERECLSERDEREARYWTRKLYEFEASDPDRWGHSGFKELYPEQFESDGGADCNRSQKNGKEKMSSSRRKSSRKSSKRKKKKKKRQKSAGLGTASDSSLADCLGMKPKRKRSKSKHNHRKKKRRDQAREEGNSESDTSESDTGTESTHRKKHRTASDAHREPERKKRKNWKSANEERSEEDSED